MASELEKCKVNLDGKPAEMDGSNRVCVLMSRFRNPNIVDEARTCLCSPYW